MLASVGALNGIDPNIGGTHCGKRRAQGARSAHSWKKCLKNLPNRRLSR